MAEGNYNGYKGAYDKRIKESPNIKLHARGIDAIPFGQMIAETSFFLCTSVMEGYGHYINHARASGGIIVTSDVPPMNELVTSTSGVMMRAFFNTHGEHFLGGISPKALSLRGVQGYVANFGGDSVCAAVDEVIKNVSVEERRRRAHRVRQQYFYDTAFFAMKMQGLRTLVGPKEAQ